MCIPNEHIFLPSNIYASDCNLYCNVGEYLDYNEAHDKLECSRCPRGTYTTRGRKIIDTWNEEVINEFQNNCYVMNDEDIKLNEQCENFQVRVNYDYTSLVVEHKNTKPGNMYSYELIYNVNLKRNGKVKIVYKKPNLNNGVINGRFKLYTNYHLKFIDNESPYTDKEKMIKEHEIELPRGPHSIMLQYMKGGQEEYDESLNFEVIQLVIEGFNGNEYECISCDESSRNEILCNSCPVDFFFDPKKNKCTLCNNDEFSISGLDYIDERDTCIKKPICNSDYVIEKRSRMCDISTNIEMVDQYFNKNAFCLGDEESQNNYSVPCADCDKGYYKEFSIETDMAQCVYCRGNTYLNEQAGKCDLCPEGTSVIRELKLSPSLQNFPEHFDDNKCYIDDFNKITGESNYVENTSCAGWYFHLTEFIPEIILQLMI